MCQWFGLSRSGLRFIILLWLRFTTEPMSTCQPISPKLVRHHRLGPDDPNNKIAGNPLLRRAAGKALQDLLDAVPVNEDWGWRLTPQLLLNERETPIAMLDQTCVPNPQRSSWILFWLSWYKIAFRFDVTATVFYLYIIHSKYYVKLL